MAGGRGSRGLQTAATLRVGRQEPSIRRVQDVIADRPGGIGPIAIVIDAGTNGSFCDCGLPAERRAAAHTLARKLKISAY